MAPKNAAASSSLAPGHIQADRSSRRNVKPTLRSTTIDDAGSASEFEEENDHEVPLSHRTRKAIDAPVVNEESRYSLKQQEVANNLRAETQQAYLTSRSLNLLEPADVELLMQTYNRRGIDKAKINEMKAGFKKFGVLGMVPANFISIAMPAAALKGVRQKTEFANHPPLLQIKAAHLPESSSPDQPARLPVKVVNGQHRIIAIQQYLAADVKLLKKKRAALKACSHRDVNSLRQLDDDVKTLSERINNQAIWGVRIYDVEKLDADGARIGRVLARNDHMPQLAETPDERLDAHLAELHSHPVESVEYSSKLNAIVREHKDRKGPRASLSNMLSPIVSIPEAMEALQYIIPGRKHFAESGLFKVKHLLKMIDIYMGLVLLYIRQSWRLLGAIGSLDQFNGDRSTIAKSRPDWAIWDDELLAAIDVVFKLEIENPVDIGMNTDQAIIELDRYRQGVVAAISQRYATEISKHSPIGVHAKDVVDRVTLVLTPAPAREHVPFPLVTISMVQYVVEAFGQYTDALLEVSVMGYLADAHHCAIRLDKFVSRCIDPLVDYRHHIQDPSHRDAWVVALRAFRMHNNWADQDAATTKLFELVWQERLNVLTFLQITIAETPIVYTRQRTLKRKEIQPWLTGTGENSWHTAENPLVSFYGLHDLSTLVPLIDEAKLLGPFMARRQSGVFHPTPPSVQSSHLRLIVSTALPWWQNVSKDAKRKVWPFVLGAYWEQAYITEVRTQMLTSSVVAWRRRVSRELTVHMLVTPGRQQQLFIFADHVSIPDEPIPDPAWMVLSGSPTPSRAEIAATRLKFQQSRANRHAAIQHVVNAVEDLPFVRVGARSVDLAVSNALNHVIDVLSFVAARAEQRDVSGDAVASLPSGAWLQPRNSFWRRPSAPDESTTWPSHLVASPVQEAEASQGRSPAVSQFNSPSPPRGSPMGDVLPRPLSVELQSTSMPPSPTQPGPYVPDGEPYDPYDYHSQTDRMYIEHELLLAGSQTSSMSMNEVEDTLG
ncbi:uncharacterized protein FIBRA_08521 [Fibroporia radiculosa]|uniref:Uncharacterized protein n=1 Tax=Fibroporia radiculosa TaxID=599839 RepID=J4ICE5_9APHY|nr:uncharacterized protein FIBRA_08521 [Fibroporia radiculosa]CCM06271.1 predicted protein [Fibroporia radiculosa]